MKKQKLITTDMPSWIYGTAWKEQTTEELTLQALTNGFIAIDTANQRKHYIEKDAGAALAKYCRTTGMQRENFFLQTKFTYTNGQDNRLPYDPQASFSEQVKQSINSSLTHLQTDYLDSYLLHGPYRAQGISTIDLEVWQTMEKFYDQGTLHMLGISNVTSLQLAELYHNAKVKPRVVQNRCYAYTMWDAEVRELCKKLDITYQGFSLLSANYEIIPHPAFQKIMARSSLTPAQVIYQAALQMGMVVLTGTTSLEHLQENIACKKSALTTAEVYQLETILQPSK